VSPASSLVLRVRGGAHLWKALSTGKRRFRLRRAAYDKAS
jgi:hypothetical protein